MSLVIQISFYLGTGLYMIAAALPLAYLRQGKKIQLVATTRLTICAVLCLAGTLILRWVAFSRVPLTTVTDSLNLLIVLASCVVLMVVSKTRLGALCSFYLPPLAIMALLNALVAHNYLLEEPKDLRSHALAAHVGLAFLAYALFYVASMTSLMYVVQAHNLKRHSTGGLFHKLPSLEQLDKTLFRMVSIGYPVFAVTVIVGLIWVRLDHELLGPYWWAAPKILISWIIFALFFASFHGRRRGLLRGTKLAYMVFLGFALILVVSIVLGLAGATTYNFWRSAT